MREENSEIQDYDYNSDLDNAYDNEATPTQTTVSGTTAQTTSETNIEPQITTPSVEERRATFQPQEVDFGIPSEEETPAEPGNISGALLGGAIGMVGCALIWTIVTVITKYQIGYMAIGVGFAVGYLIQRMGKGSGMTFGIIGATFSLLACFFGNLFSQIVLVADEFEVSYFDALTNLGIAEYVDLMKYSFHPMDIVFYGFALYFGFKIAYQIK